ncbi:MAG: hypothetical protein IJT01_04240 [Selenomonadaceae bacterium]|nr:hypothetical protein [Selenomonadaceae bacterium]
MDLLAKWQERKSESGKLSRRSWAEIFYTPKGGGDTTDITEDVSKYFISLSCTDNLSDQADDLSLSLEDRQRLWTGDWMPEKGAFLSAILHTFAWGSLEDGEKSMDLGRFEIDGFSGTEIPTAVQIKAISILSDNTNLRETKKSRSWDKIQLQQIANDVAEENGLSLFWDVDEDPEVDHVEQSDESDLEMLQRLCKDAGHALKVTIEQIIIFDEYKYEQKDATLRVLHPEEKDDGSGLETIQKIEDFHFEIKTREVYGSCHVKHQQGKEKEVIEATFTAPDADGNSKTLHVKESVKDENEALRLAKKRLREKNKDAVTIGFRTLGNFSLAAGNTVMVEGFGKLDGKYIITKAQHSLSDGFRTSVDMRRCLDGY